MEKRIYFTSNCRLLIVILISLLTFVHLHGLNPSKSVDQYLLDSWEIANGFPSNEVTSVAQTPDGYLWFATSKSLVRFDGITFSIISFTKKEEIAPLETAIPLRLFVDNNGTLWIGSSVGLTSYNHRDGFFQTYTSANGLSGNRVSCIQEDMLGNLWISYMGGYVDRLTNGKFTSFNETHGLKKGINAIVENRNGNLLFATRENGIFEYRNNRFSRYDIAGLGKRQLYAMVEDGNGVLWIGTNNGLFQVNNKATIRYTTGDGLPDDKIVTILEDSEQNFWVGTLEGGLIRIKKTGDGEIVSESVPKTGAFKILYLFEDREKSLWVSTLDSGIKRLKDGKFTSYAPLEPHHKEIFLSLFRDSRGHIWTGTYTGKLFRCKDGELLDIIDPPEISGAGITAIEEDREGNLWIGTNGKGVFLKKEGAFTRFTTREGLSDNMVNSIYCDRSGNLCICTFNGISIKQPHIHEFASYTRQDGLPDEVVYSVYEDKSGRILIETDSGIALFPKGFTAPNQRKRFASSRRSNTSAEEKQSSSRWPAGHSKKVFGPTFLQKGGTDAGIKKYLEGVSITCIYEDPDSPEEGPLYWIATDGAGLKRLRLKDGKVTNYTTAHGMVTNMIYQFFEDRDKNFWLMSNSGVLRVNKNELNRFAHGQVEYLNCISFGIADGMKSSEFNSQFSPHSALKTSRGEFWFVTKKGISCVDPETIGINKTAPQVAIEQVWFDRKVVSRPIRSISYTYKGIRDVTFRFTAPTFLSPEKIKFKYQIEGIDKKWLYLPAGKERIALYEDVEPGAYTFRVVACNAEGIWNPKATSFTFTLKPLFYQTLLFKIALFILLAGFACIAIYIYKKRPFDKKTKYKGSSLNEKLVQECFWRLKHLMEVEKLYRDEDITLRSLAEMVRIPSHILSRILNEKLHRKFSDYINYHRIEEAKDILMSPESSDKKISTVAYDVGFNALTVFYKAFKKFTGKTPRQYKKEKNTK